MNTPIPRPTLQQEMRTLEDWCSNTIALLEATTIEPNRNEFISMLVFVDMMLRTWQEKLDGQRH